MNKALAAALVVCAALTMEGCIGRALHGDDSGPQSSKTVQLTGFHKVKSKGSADLTITVGGKESITVEGSENRVKSLTTTVEDGTLVLDEKSQGIFGGNGRLHVTITVPSLDGLEIDGSGDAEVTGVKGDTFTVSINGSGDVTVSGDVKSATLAIHGSGDVDAKGLKAKQAGVSIAGSGNINVAASDTLEVSLAGSGDITYYGDPKVTQSVTGSGDVNKG